MNHQELEARNKKLEKRWKITLVIAVLFVITRPVALYIINRYIHKAVQDQTQKRQNGVLRQTNTGYKLIQPLLDSEYDTEEEGINLYPYEKQIEADVTKITNDHKETLTGFYFSDLSNLSWVGVNENDKFIPASTIKVPLLIAYYRLKEIKEHGLFETKVTYSGENFDENKNITSEHGIKPGQTYTIREMLEDMIIYSDNNALEFLYNYRATALSEIFADLQAPLPKDREGIANQDFLSPKEWAKFLIVLYNASYLSRDDSEEALNLMTKTEFKDGLVAGLPDNITIAHKFGERKLNVGTDKETNELHDCGIVYYTSRPYLLCVMTRGKDLNKQVSVIKEISKIVYRNISEAKMSWNRSL